MTWSARPTIKPGRYPRGDEIEAILDQIDALTAPGWTDYSSTFTVTATTTPPTQGNSTYTAHYRRSVGGDLVTVRIYILIGSTFSGGSGLYRFLVPIAASSNSMNGSVGNVSVIDAGTAGRTAIAEFVDSTHLQFVRNGDASAFTSILPQTWATGDIIRAQIDYEPA